MNASNPYIPTYCRDCGSHQSSIADNCSFCGGVRLISHPEANTLSIAHMDCDAFFAAIEKRDNPDLIDKPVLVGGGKRGVVSTCCYIARLYGVRSAIPMFKALKACPDAVVVKPNYEKYRTASLQIREKMTALTPLVQVVSIDEAYMDLTGTEKLHHAAPVELLMRLQSEIEREIGITVSIGLSFNKFLAKTASELDKPNGFALIGHEDAKSILSERPVGFLHGVGPKLAQSLERDGYGSVAKIQASDPKDLIRRYGETGLWLHQRANGIDNRPVRIDSERKSVSAETTFETDIRDRKTLEDRLWMICEKTARRAKELDTIGSVVTLKLKTSDFKTRTRRASLSEPTHLARTLFDVGANLLAQEAHGGAYRLIGIGISELEPFKGDTEDLVDPRKGKRAAAERAADLARTKFGTDAIMTGRGARLVADRRKNSDTET